MLNRKKGRAVGKNIIIEAMKNGFHLLTERDLQGITEIALTAHHSTIGMESKLPSSVMTFSYPKPPPKNHQH
jgi:hypothetical protein